MRTGKRCGENRAPPRSPPNSSPNTGKRVGFTSGAAAQLSVPKAWGQVSYWAPKGSSEFGLTFLKPPSLGNFVLSQPLTSLHPSQKAGSWTRGLGLPPAALCQQRQMLASEHTFWGDHAFNDGLSKRQPEPQPNSMATAPGQNHLRPLRRPSLPDRCHGLSPGPPHGSCSGIWTQPAWGKGRDREPRCSLFTQLCELGRVTLPLRTSVSLRGCPCLPQRVAMENRNSKCRPGSISCKPGTTPSPLHTASP